MTEFDDQTIVAQTTRVLQIIVGAMAVGLLGFLLIVLYLVERGEIQVQRAPGVPPVLTYVALILGTIVIIGSVAIPKILVAGARRRLETTAVSPGHPIDVTSSVSSELVLDLLAVLRTQLIVGVAMLEGVGMLATIAYMLERRPLVLSLAIVMILGVVTRIPTRARVQQWLEAQSELILQSRMFGEP